MNFTLDLRILVLLACALALINLTGLVSVPVWLVFAPFWLPLALFGLATLAAYLLALATGGEADCSVSLGGSWGKGAK